MKKNIWKTKIHKGQMTTKEGQEYLEGKTEFLEIKL